MRKALTFFSMLAASFLMADVLPEYMKVYPIPQEVTLGDHGTYTKPTMVAVRNVEAFDVDALRVLKGFVTVADKAAFVLNWKWDDTLRSEGYTLKLTETASATSLLLKPSLTAIAFTVVVASSFLLLL